MSCVLFPGRHLVGTVFQQEYLGRVLTGDLRSMPGFLGFFTLEGKPLPWPPTNMVLVAEEPDRANP